MAKDNLKYTKYELQDRNISFYVPSKGDKWQLKKATYTNEGVLACFKTLRTSFEALFNDHEAKPDRELAYRAATWMIDTFLMRRVKGFDVQMPKEVVPINAASQEDADKAVVKASDFEGKPDASENDKIRWVFENMQVAGLMPKDAPSAGAWALREELRLNAPDRRDFYKNVWPKLMTKEDGEKSGKLQDTGKNVLDLIKRLQEALPESEE